MKILIPTSSEGHLSIAQAITDILSSNYQVNQITNSFIEKIFVPYTFLYQLSPQLTGLYWHLSDSENINNFVSKNIWKQITPELEVQIQKIKPDLVINTNFAYNHSLNQLQKKYHYHQINIITDPRTPHIAIFNPTCPNLIFDKKTIIKGPIHPDNLILSGWFTQNKYYEKLADKQSLSIYKKLNFNPKINTYLICGGSEGMTSSILKIIPAFISTSVKTQLIIVCGNNRPLKKILETFYLNLKELFPSAINNLNLRIIGFTKDLDQYMKISQMVIGKAGPNLLFESVATGKPFFAIANLPGQEEGNLDLIKDYQIGIIEKNPFKANKLLTTIIKNPNYLDQFKSHLKLLRNYNQNSTKILLKQVNKTLNS